MINDRFTVTNASKFYQGQSAAPAPEKTTSWNEPQDWVFDARTGSLTVCNIPPSVSQLQNYGGFNFTA